MALKMIASIENDKTSIDGIENDKNKHNQILSAKERFFSLGPHHSYPVLKSDGK